MRLEWSSPSHKGLWVQDKETPQQAEADAAVSQSSRSQDSGGERRPPATLPGFVAASSDLASLCSQCLSTNREDRRLPPGWPGDITETPTQHSGGRAGVTSGDQGRLESSGLRLGPSALHCGRPPTQIPFLQLPQVRRFSVL